MKMLHTLLLFLSLSGLAFAEAPPPVEISDGSRIAFPERGFSIEPPAGWEVHRNIPNLTLLLQVPKGPGEEYQRNITLRQGHGPYAIDSYTAGEFGKQIVERRAHILPGITNYRLRNHETVDLTDGRKGLLFYAQFELNTIPMMEMHLLASTADGHFILTFTDVAAHFDTSSNLPYLNEAFKSVTSIHTDTTSKARFSFVTTLLAAFVVGGALFFAVRKLSSRGLGGHDGFDEGDAPESLAGSSFSKSFASNDGLDEASDYADLDEAESVHGEALSEMTSDHGEAKQGKRGKIAMMKAKSKLKAKPKKAKASFEDDDDAASAVESDEDLEYMQVSAEAAEESDDGDWAVSDAGADDDTWQDSSSLPPPPKIRKNRAG